MMDHKELIEAVTRHLLGLLKPAMADQKAARTMIRHLKGLVKALEQHEQSLKRENPL